VPRILIVDECGVSRQGLRCLFEQRIPNAQVSDLPRLTSAFPFVNGDHFDIILVDFDALDGHSRDSLDRTFNIPKNSRIVVTSAVRSRENVLGCLANGFHGFLDRLQPDHLLLSSLDDICNGRICIPAWIVERGETPVTSPRTDGHYFATLTPRQRSVLSLIAQGLSNKEIAHLLHISEGTTKIHTGATLRALGARNRTEAAAKATELQARHAGNMHRSAPPMPDAIGLIRPLSKIE
jgi:DNA-binding NarL/FixJ family response regulator